MSTDVLALHITQQNAGLIIRRQDAIYSMETFELSPTSTAIMGTTGRLVRRFPGPVIAISDRRVRDLNFRKAFTECITCLEGETLDGALSKGYERTKRLYILDLLLNGSLAY